MRRFWNSFSEYFGRYTLGSQGSEEAELVAAYVRSWVLFPAIILYILVTTNPTINIKHKLSPISFLFLFIIGVALIVLSAFAHRNYSWVFLFFIFVINTFSLLSHANVCLLTCLLVVLFGVCMVSSDTVDRWPEENWLTSFIVEKLGPMTLVSLAFGFESERNHRLAHLKMREINLQHEDTVREQEVTDSLLGNTLPAPIIAQLEPFIAAFGYSGEADGVVHSTDATTVCGGAD